MMIEKVRQRDHLIRFTADLRWLSKRHEPEAYGTLRDGGFVFIVWNLHAEDIAKNWWRVVRKIFRVATQRGGGFVDVARRRHARQ